MMLKTPRKYCYFTNNEKKSWTIYIIVLSVLSSLEIQGHKTIRSLNSRVTNFPGKRWYTGTVASEMTQRQNTRHTRDRQYTLRPEGHNCAKLIAVYYYKRPLGRIPGCMNKPFQYRAGAYMLSYSKGEWNPCLLQSLSKALFSFLSQEGNAPSFARDH